MFQGKSQPESDDRPALFWMSNTLNYVHSNAASGGKFGIWFELRVAVSQFLHPRSKDYNYSSLLVLSSQKV